MSELSEREERRIVEEANRDVAALCGQSHESILTQARAWAGQKENVPAEIVDAEPTVLPPTPQLVEKIGEKNPGSDWCVRTDGSVALVFGNEVRIVRGDSVRVVDLTGYIDSGKSVVIRPAPDGCWLLDEKNGSSKWVNLEGKRNPFYMPELKTAKKVSVAVCRLAVWGRTHTDIMLYDVNCGWFGRKMLRVPESISSWQGASYKWCVHPDGVVIWNDGWMHLLVRDGETTTNRVVARMPHHILDDHLQCTREGFYYRKSCVGGSAIWFEPWPSAEELYRVPKFRFPEVFQRWDARDVGATDPNNYGDSGAWAQMLHRSSCGMFYLFMALTAWAALAGNAGKAWPLYILDVLMILAAVVTDYRHRTLSWNDHAETRALKMGKVKENVPALVPIDMTQDDAVLVRLFLEHRLDEMREHYAGDGSALATNLAEMQVKERELQALASRYEAHAASLPETEAVVVKEAGTRARTDLADLAAAHARLTGARGKLDGYLTECKSQLGRRTATIQLLREGSELSASVRDLIERSERELAEDVRSFQLGFDEYTRQVAEFQSSVRGMLAGDDDDRRRLAEFDFELQMSKLPRLDVAAPAITPTKTRVDVVDAEIDDEEAAEAEIEQAEEEQRSRS